MLGVVAALGCRNVLEGQKKAHCASKVVFTVRRISVEACSAHREPDSVCLPHQANESDIDRLEWV